MGAGQLHATALMVPVDTAKGEQHSASYRAINPNGKTPALVDGDAVVFDSIAIA